MVTPRKYQYDYTVFKNGKWSELETVHAESLNDAISRISAQHKVAPNDDSIEIRGSDNPRDGDLYVGGTL
jgi:hypothetical protein